MIFLVLRVSFSPRYDEQIRYISRYKHEYCSKGKFKFAPENLNANHTFRGYFLFSSGLKAKLLSNH